LFAFGEQLSARAWNTICHVRFRRVKFDFF
jgi:hypothetical protein